MWGPIIGVSVFQAISLWIGTFSPYNQLFLGVAVLVTAVLFKSGIIVGAGRVADRVRPTRSAAPAVGVGVEDTVARKSVWAGTSVVTRVDLSGRGCITKKN